MAANPNTDFVAGAILTASQQNRFGRGVMAYARSTVNASQTSGSTDIAAMSLTFTAVANRLYRATFECFYAVSADSLNNFTICDSANNVLDQMYQNSVNGIFMNATMIYTFTASAGPFTIKPRIGPSTGTMTIYGATADNRSYSFLVEDLGPA